MLNYLQKMFIGRAQRSAIVRIFFAMFFILGSGAFGFTVWAQTTDYPWFAVREDGSGPRITNVQAAFTNARTLTVSWQTDIPTTSAVEYATRAQYQAISNYPFPSYKEDETYATNHIVTISNLIPNETYFYKIRSIDQNLVETNSPINNIPGVSSPFPSTVVAVSPTPGSILGTRMVFSWNAVAFVRGYIVYFGSAVGGKDIYSTGPSLNLNTNVSIKNIPTDGRTLYLRVWYYKTSSGWSYNDFVYKAFAPTVSPGGTEISTNPGSNQSVLGLAAVSLAGAIKTLFQNFLEFFGLGW